MPGHLEHGAHRQKPLPNLVTPVRRGLLLALALLVLLPLLANILPLLGVVQADQRLIYSGLQQHVVPGFLPGLPSVDNSGGTAYQPAAREALRQWLSGSVPWWDHYQGIGFPLAGELIPGAFSPFLFLQLVPNAAVVQQLVAQIACGLLTFLALRLLSCGVFAALIGGAMFELNGTFAWLGSLWCHPLVALPLSVIGVELLRRTTRRETILGMFCLACATYLAIVASFIEIGYLNGLLVVAWLLVRMSQTTLHGTIRLIALSSMAFVVGLMLAAPQLSALLDALQYGLASHSGGIFGPLTLGRASVPQLVMPYLWGPIHDYATPDVAALWNNVGGYMGIAPIVVASAALTLRSERRVAFMLVGWIVLTVGAQAGVLPMVWLMNRIPGVSFIWQSRYSASSWEFALAVLCAFLINEWSSKRNPFLAPLHKAALAALGLTLAASLVANGTLLHELLRQPRYWMWLSASALLALSVCGILVLLMTRQSFRARRLIGVAIVCEALISYAVPTLSLPRYGTLDQNLVTFLAEHIGYARLYSLDRFAPNYGTYYRLPMIDYVEPIVPELWANEVTTTLDPYTVSPFFFLERRIGDSSDRPSREAVLASHATSFGALGLRFAIDRPGRLESAFDRSAGRPRIVYRDDVAAIYQLPDEKPYAAADHCRLSFASRDDIGSDCTERSRLIRRELYFPGWSARVNGTPTQLRSFSGLFQQVALPRGRSLVRFRYAPAHERVAFILWALAIVLLAIGTIFVLREQRRLHG